MSHLEEYDLHTCRCGCLYDANTLSKLQQIVLELDGLDGTFEGVCPDCAIPEIIEHERKIQARLAVLAKHSDTIKESLGS